MSKTKEELSKEQLKNITGGNGSIEDEIEEFDWKDVGHYTPIKHEAGDNSWEFSGEGNVEGQYFKKIKEGSDRIN